MESFSVINKQTSVPSSPSYLQQHIPLIQSPIPSGIKNESISTYQEKAPFLKYASSLIEIGTQDQQKNQNIHVYQESELLNPPQSLIEKYETMRRERPSFGNISCESFKHKTNSIRSIEKGLNKIAVLLQSRYDKNVLFNKNKPISSLIDILALSSMESIPLPHDKTYIKEAFIKIKSIYLGSIGKTKMIKPLIPIDKKKNPQQSAKQSNNLLKQIFFSKKKGTEQLLGILTFKVLVLESQCFKIIKTNLLYFKVKKIIFPIQKLLIKNSFFSIKSFNTKKLLRLGLSSSKSKSKISSSKLKIHQNNSEAKFILKKNKQSNGNFLIGQEKPKQQVENSEITQNFDMNKFGSNTNSDETQKSDRKMGFSSLLKKKVTKQSNSQVDTVNSKRTSQSQYQFTQGISSKASSYKMSPSVKGYSPKYATYYDDLQQIPTEKFIRKRKPSQSQDFDKISLSQQINPAKEMRILQKSQKKNYQVRTNLFELPIQLVIIDCGSNKSVNQEPMKKIYHMLPDALIQNDCSQNQNLVNNINIWGEKISHGGIKVDTSQKQIARESIDRNQRKKKHIETKDVQNIQKYYFGRGIDTNNLNVQHTQCISQKDLKILSNQKSNPQATETMLKTIRTPILNQTLQTDLQSNQKNSIKPNDKKVPKTQSPKNDNFQQYYFKAQIQKKQPNNLLTLKTERQHPTISKVIRPVNFVKNPQNNQGTNTKELHEAKHKNFKLLNAPHSAKSIKSLSPKVNFTSQSPSKNGKLENRSIYPNNHQIFGTGLVSNDSSISAKKVGIQIKRSPSKIFAIPHDAKLKSMNQLPIELDSSGTKTPQNLHGLITTNNSGAIFQNRSKLKIKIFQQSPRSLSPQQNTQMVTQHRFPSQNSHKKQSFIINQTPQKVITLNRPPSNHTFHEVQPVYFTPTNSNLSNQSGFNKNIHKVINYGPSVGFSHEMTNRPSSILSTHSNQSREKIIVQKTSHTLLSPTQKQMHMMMGPPEIMVENKNLLPRTVIYQEAHQVKSYSPQVHSQQMMSGKTLRRGLNVMGSGDQVRGFKNQSPNLSRLKLNKFTRQKSTSNEKIFLRINK